ncbi:TIGR03089 family protein [Corynebacterium sanguinis]|uniref:TIGR03089 family protein n=1 Tax=Corynebacterium sanguinis TaxID=2594913 RepID=UPI00223BC637|nr:TIGR03089 family protein [Corynebacterium sanguinis]MCT1584326.1 TIGR03089 family protein [Corynebacterium sanguinis]MCT2023715.1 TIGR03089 family protein [Corynebacterium sanguinis]MCT2047479.1 TIGR03089 family protein [Corynebacterium sanguinis]MDN8577238.1 TIGR03089 family protein [Corynebacterium sanguinis]
MSIMAPLVASQPSSPRLTVYDETAGTRMDFSAQTLDNWAAKIANMLDEEFELATDAVVVIDLPASWQAAVIALGTFNSARTPLFDAPTDAAPDVVFTHAERAAEWSGVSEVVVVSTDPFGRGVAEAGGQVPAGTVDFGPTVRFYGDVYYGDSPKLRRWAKPEYGPQRYMVDPWRTTADFENTVLAPLAADGSVVVAAGLASAERLREIAETENVTHFLTAG